MKDKKSFLAKYATRPAALEKGSKSNSLTDDTPQDPSAFMVYPFKKAIEAINLIVDFITAPEATMSRPDYLQIKLDEICQQKGIQQGLIEKHDVQTLQEKNISPIELNKMKHRFLQSNKALNKQIDEIAPDLPRTEKGTVDFEKCSEKQKLAITKTVETFINNNPEYKKMLENILQRKISSDEVKRDASGLSATYMTQANAMATKKNTGR
ncbi:MAG: hypothetical protein IJV75_01370 [Alphaproteobacteria bacterium]|nr:hypothetical protein [Alphaproteobacteria bacterium]